MKINLHSEGITNRTAKVTYKLFIARLVFLLITAFFAVRLIPYLGNFPYKDLIDRYYFPPEVYSFANFDGAHYISIAEKGYAEFEQAFFPLYPLFMKGIGYILEKNYLLAGLLISNISFLLGLVFFYRWLKEFFPLEQTVWIIVSLLVFPTAFFFSAVYSEGLFFLFTTASLYFLKKNNTLLSALFAALSALTRLQGMLLVIFFFFSFFQHKRDFISNIKVTFKKHFMLVISPLFGTVIYMTYLFKTEGDPLLFLNVQPMFGAMRSSHLIILPQVYFRYIKIFLTSAHTFQYFIALLEFTMVTLTLFSAIYLLMKAWKRRNYFLIGLSLFSLAHILLPTLTGTFSSVPRYALMALSTYVVISDLKPKYRYAVAGLSILLQIILTSLFIQGYFIS